MVQFLKEVLYSSKVKIDLMLSIAILNTTLK